MSTEAEKKEASRARIEHLVVQQSQILAILVGIPGTEEKGMAGDIADLSKQGVKRNGRIGRLEIGLASLISILTGLGILDATVFHRVIGG
ncbi:hypothetical protein LCGC14_2521140 [marine sediment metagenome]|uniref:Uncharacterized protein n=2 Tax=marine sediment metagenome TaxID=412755 RepID=A0A0F9AWS4_9ZZZZ